MTTTSQTISLDKLIPWSGNVRKTDAAEGIEELAASIASHGLLQPLLVRKDKRGKFAVIAGQRRLLALQALAQQERIDGDCAVECRVTGGEISPAELSLAENIVRAAMHPADEFEAFRDLIDSGASVSDVASRFGVCGSRVAKHLRLGRLSPVILAAYRADDIGLEEAMAFTLSTDHAEQERVFEGLPPWQSKPSYIRRALTQGEIAASDPRVQLIGLEAYETAGGSVRRDLFDDENAGYVQDAALLDRLAMAELEGAAVSVRAEGWSWVDCTIDLDWNTLSQFRRVQPERDALPDEAQAEIDALEAEYDALNDALEADEEDAQANERQAQIDERLTAIRASCEKWLPETLAMAGAIVTLDGDGKIEIKRGLVRPGEDRKTAKSAKDKSGAASSGEKPLPSTLVADLSANRTAAISAALSCRPDIALAATVHALALQVFYHASQDSCLRLSLRSPDLGKSLFDADACKALSHLSAEQERWTKRLPRQSSALWQWCLEQKRAVLLDLLAVIAAHSVDAVMGKSQSLSPQQSAHADALSQTLKLDTASWYRPTASGYFGRISRPAIIAAIEEATGKRAAPAWQKLTRADLAKRAEKMIRPTSWLPAQLRITCDHASEPITLAEAAE